MDEIRPKRDRNRSHEFDGVQTYDKMQRRFARLAARLKELGESLTEAEVAKLYGEEGFKDFFKRFAHVRNDIRKLSHGCASFIKKCKREAEK
jgi:hypothetical protein